MAEKKAARGGGKGGKGGKKGAAGAGAEPGDAAPGVRKLESPSGWPVFVGRNSRRAGARRQPLAASPPPRPAGHIHAAALPRCTARALRRRGNETVSHVLARDTDVWFHLRGLPGAHVLLRVPPGKARPPSRICSGRPEPPGGLTTPPRRAAPHRGLQVPPNISPIKQINSE